MLSSSDAGWDFVMVAMAEGSSQGREMIVRAHLTASTHPVSFPFPFPFPFPFSRVLLHLTLSHTVLYMRSIYAPRNKILPYFIPLCPLPELIT